MKPRLVYASGNAIAWLRNALAGIDEGLASLCRQLTICHAKIVRIGG